MIDLSVFNPLAETRTEIGYILQGEGRHIFHPGCSHAEEICPLRVVQNKRGTQVFGERTDLHIAYRDVFHVTQIESLGRHRAKHIRLGILVLYFRRLYCSRFGSPAASMLNVDVADLTVFDRMPGNAAED